MIDLGKLKNKHYSIKLKNGKILNIKPPTRAMMINLMELTKADTKTDDEAFEELYSLLTDIFNRNINKIHFSKTKIENMIEEPTTALYILQDYLEHSFKIMGE